jgi:hypothetical protein
VKTDYTIKPGFLYNTSVTEILALIGVLLLLGTTESSKGSTASIWAKDGTGKRWYWQANLHSIDKSEAFFVSCAFLTL